MLDQMAAESFDERALADSRYARDADAFGVAGAGQQFLQYFLRLCFVPGRRAFDHGNGAGQNAPIARQHARDVVIRP